MGPRGLVNQGRGRGTGTGQAAVKESPVLFSKSSPFASWVLPAVWPPGQFSICWELGKTGGGTALPGLR